MKYLLNEIKNSQLLSTLLKYQSRCCLPQRTQWNLTKRYTTISGTDNSFVSSPYLNSQTISRGNKRNNVYSHQKHHYNLKHHKNISGLPTSDNTKGGLTSLQTMLVSISQTQEPLVGKFITSVKPSMRP